VYGWSLLCHLRRAWRALEKWKHFQSGSGEGGVISLLVENEVCARLACQMNLFESLWRRRWQCTM